ncbi:MAG: CDP-glucose 4,6-dehydratase [Deinococcus-Thermus bacterium]|nr:CDP-glucose 4,6-dehydratase [Deinococcota bacterium]
MDDVYDGRAVFLTGHTGFKGTWLALWLASMGARVTGFSDRVPTEPSAFELMRLGNMLSDQRGDIADVDRLGAAMAAAAPSVVFHLAAQPIVRAGFRDPFETFRTNVMGTAAVLEACRSVPSVRAVVVVTSDKVYANDGSVWPFRETDRLGGHEPYGASKAAAEIVAETYRAARFHQAAGSATVPALATARAGNVIGGGDWAPDRLLPDFVRAVAAGRQQEIRQPRATRPWQHVLEPLGGYLMLGAALLEAAEGVPPALNFGPAEPEAPTVETVARAFLDALGAPPDTLVVREDAGSAEAPSLRVDSSLAAGALGWRPTWSASEAIRRAAEWYAAHLSGRHDMRETSIAQLRDYRKASTVAALQT